jgi:hypothetical protein
MPSIFPAAISVLPARLGWMDDFPSELQRQSASEHFLMCCFSDSSSAAMLHFKVAPHFAQVDSTVILLRSDSTRMRLKRSGCGVGLVAITSRLRQYYPISNGCM